MKHEKERILKLVEEGKLSAKEALILIEKLEEDYKETESKVTALSEDVIDSEDFYGEKKKNRSLRSVQNCSNGLIPL